MRLRTDGRVDFYGLAILWQIPTRYLDPQPRPPDALRHAQHVGRPHPECEVCRAKGRV